MQVPLLTSNKATPIIPVATLQSYCTSATKCRPVLSVGTADIPEGNSEQALEAIRRILDGRDWEDRPLQSDFERFRADHGVPRLESLLGGILNRV